MGEHRRIAQGQDDVEAMLASIREAIHAHAAEKHGAGQASPGNAGQRTARQETSAEERPTQPHGKPHISPGSARTPGQARESRDGPSAQVIAMTPRPSTPVAEGALALNTTSMPSAQASSAPAPAARLSAPVQRKVQAALQRLERLEHAKQALGGEEALRALVSDLLEPMLQRWLEEHLEEIVERRVAEEIARIMGH